MTVEVRPLRDNDVAEALELIMRVAHGLFAPGVSLESFRSVFVGIEGEFADVYAHDSVYAPPDGLFLVAEDEGRIIGTGAIRRLDEQTAELKRMWLLEAYQGQGIGYQIIRQLIAFAQQQGFERIFLTTTIRQERAIAFYQRVGFQRIPLLPEHPEHGEGFEVAMELALPIV